MLCIVLGSGHPLGTPANLEWNSAAAVLALTAMLCGKTSSHHAAFGLEILRYSPLCFRHAVWHESVVVMGEP